MKLTAHITESPMVTNSHIVRIFYGDEMVTSAHLTLDQIEDLEGDITDIMMQLARYRRKLQREEL